MNLKKEKMYYKYITIDLVIVVHLLKQIQY